MNLKRIKNRQRKALRSGKNNSRLNNQLTNQEIKTRIVRYLENHAAEILESAKECYEVAGRGCVNISLTNHPNNPYKTGEFYYVNEESNIIIQSGMPFLNENDILISEGILTYEPTIQAVVCVWYGTMNFVTTLTATSVVLRATRKQESLTIH